MIAQATELKPGDLLLLKQEKSIVHAYLREHYGTIVENIATAVTGQQYLHVELYLGEGWIISATVNGVKLSKYPVRTIIDNFDIFRPKFDIDEDLLVSLVDEYHNKPYDFTSLYLNIIKEITKIFGVDFEFPYDTKFMLICSEMVSRIYESLGVSFHDKSEYVTPQEIVDSNLFEKI
jgi:hypothetical protein